MAMRIYQTPIVYRLAAFRSSLDLTRIQAAEHADVDERTWARWELGETTPEAALWMKIPTGLRFASFDAFWQAYCRFCCEHPEITAVGLRPPAPKEAGDVAQDPQGYQAAPGLHDMLAGMLRIDIESVFLSDWRVQLRRQQTSLLERVAQLIQDILDFQWLYDKARKKNPKD